MREGLLKENIDGEALTGRTAASSAAPKNARF
jgi:cobalamin biosynthesis protein CobT